MSFFATAAKGTEPALRDELRELGFQGVRAQRGGVLFEGGLDEGARACLWSRVAVRILAPLAEFAAPDGTALYQGVYGIDWSRYLTPDRTLAVRASSRGSRMTHTQFIAQRTKDAVVDQLRDAEGVRPSVHLGDPDVSIFVHLVESRARVYVDLSGQPLHLRGYRAHPLEAPIKETLAAAVVRFSGWDRRTPFIDPMCGSGTIAIEAAMWAANIAPGLRRRRFGFERWAMHDDEAAAAVQRLRDEARAAARSDVPVVLASDVSREAVQATLENARAAGVAVRVERRSVEGVSPLGPAGALVTNPPYGERLQDEEGLYERLGRVVAAMPGHRVAILAGTPRIEPAIPLAPHKRRTLLNGAIECQLLVYEPSPARAAASASGDAYL
jgi:putative N6-adenine-specific DNA methylase